MDEIRTHIDVNLMYQAANRQQVGVCCCFLRKLKFVAVLNYPTNILIFNLSSRVMLYYQTFPSNPTLIVWMILGKYDKIKFLIIYINGKLQGMFVWKEILTGSLQCLIKSYCGEQFIIWLIVFLSFSSNYYFLHLILSSQHFVSLFYLCFIPCLIMFTVSIVSSKTASFI